MNRTIFIAIAMTVCTGLSAKSVRTETQLTNGWRFSHTDSERNALADFDDSAWEVVSVPHDWAIAGPFDNNNDRQTVAIEQNGEQQATEKTGRTGVDWHRVVSHPLPHRCCHESRRHQFRRCHG